MRKIEDKFMVRRYGKGDTFRIYYPSSCYKSGFSINKAEQIAIRDQKGRPLSEFPMESFAMEIIVPKKIFKDAIVNEIHTKKAHLSVYIPVETDGTYIYPNKDYKSIMKAIKVAIYEHFNDTYHIPLKECEEVSDNLIQKSLDDPLFMDDIINKITKLIYELRDVFDFEPSINMFSNMSDSRLLQYYQRHDEVHRKLYIYARIPETLDRGVSTFTNYLKDYLKERNEELYDDRKLNEVFEILTYPENISMSGIEILELYQLICDIKKDEKESQIKAFSGSGKRTMIRMNYDTYHKVENFANKWAFWGYHGYGHRAIRDFNYFVERLKL